MMADSPEQSTAQLVEALRAVLAQVAEPAAVLGAILQQAVLVTGADRGLFVEVLEDGALDYRVLHGCQARHFEGEAGAFSRHLFGRVVKSGERVLLERAADDAYFGEITSVQSMRTAAILCVPLTAGGRVSALLYLENRRPGHFTAEHVDLLRSLVTVAVPILETLREGREVLRERDQLRLTGQRFQQEAQESRELLARDWSFGRFIGRSQAVRTLEATIQKAAVTDYPILLQGEPGTGKSILARVLHYAGSRSGRPLVTVFCPSFEKGMVEAELFGHKRGAFTGALSDRTGKLEAAHGGTLFLDEVGELPLEIQPKLLRFLQEKTYERLGDSREQTADVRIIAASNRDLRDEVAKGRFRQDLFDRLNFLPIRVPPLRERREDIGALLRHSLDRTASGRWVEVSAEATRYLEQLDSPWPGNVRHIEQLAARLTTENGREPVSAADMARLLDLSGEASSSRSGPVCGRIEPGSGPRLAAREIGTRVAGRSTAAVSQAHSSRACRQAPDQRVRPLQEAAPPRHRRPGERPERLSVAGAPA
jgi:Nif-specific regulatory protein